MRSWWNKGQQRCAWGTSGSNKRFSVGNLMRALEGKDICEPRGQTWSLRYWTWIRIKWWGGSNRRNQRRTFAGTTPWSRRDPSPLLSSQVTCGQNPLRIDKNGQSFLKGGKALNTPSENATGAQGPKSDLLPTGQVSRLPSLSTSSFHTLTFIPIYYLQVSRRWPLQGLSQNVSSIF